jgi:hypothetical protein
MFVVLAGTVVIVPVVNATLVISVFAPDAAAPSDVLAAEAVVAFVPPLAIGKVPVTPVVKGSPVALVKVAADGVPKLGVTSVGLVERTTEPDPVLVVTPVPPFATARVPAIVKVPEDVTGPPENVIPVVPPEAFTLVTVPETVEAIETPPEEFVILIPLPAVKVANVYPDPLPINKAPLAGVVVIPVPPDATGKVPVVSAEVEVAYRAPPLVKLVRLVPPFDVPSVPIICDTLTLPE